MINFKNTVYIQYMLLIIILFILDFVGDEDYTYLATYV